MKTCIKCNLAYDDEKKFCKRCGTALISEIQINPRELAKKNVLEDRLKIDPLNIELLHEYVLFLFNNLLFKEVVSISLKLLALDEKDRLAKELLFKSYIKLNMFSEADEAGKHLLEESPYFKDTSKIIILLSLRLMLTNIGNLQ